MAHLYYVEAGRPLVPGDTARLVGDEARHAASVARLTLGERIRVGDGAGTLATATAREVSPKEVQLQIQDTTFQPPNQPEVWLVQALAKGDRDELAVQTCTELGVDRIIPWQASRSVSRWMGDKLDTGVARWQKIAVEASKQSLRAWVPQVEQAMTTQEIANLGDVHQLLLLDPEASDSLSAFIPRPDRNLLVMVGPEGGVDAAEAELLLDSGAVDLKLGSTVLRTSSAGPAALALVNSSMGRW